jgi:hypothetical protein
MVHSSKRLAHPSKIDPPLLHHYASARVEGFPWAGEAVEPIARFRRPRPFRTWAAQPPGESAKLHFIEFFTANTHLQTLAGTRRQQIGRTEQDSAALRCLGRARAD